MVGNGEELLPDYPTERGVPPYNETFMLDVSLLPLASIPM